MYQDNHISMRMEECGRNHCTGNLIHINARYCFVKDRENKGEVKIEYCPTQVILAEYFTKHIKAKVLKIFRDIIMGYNPILSLE